MKKITGWNSGIKKLFLCLGVITVILLTESGLICAATIGQSVGIASSPNPVGSGARALAMGGAFIGLADDATAASWNPAALIQLERPEISLVGDYFFHSYEFSSSDHPEANNRTTSQELNINYFSATYPFNLFNKNMVASVNYQRLYDFNRSLSYGLELSSSTPSGSIISSSEMRQYEQNGSIGALGLAYSIELTYSFSLGITVNLWTDKLIWHNGWDEVYSNHVITSFGSNTTVEDTQLVDRYENFSGVNMNIGFLWDINQYLTLGGVIKTPFTADIDHFFSEDWTLKDSDGNILSSANIPDQDEKVELDMPFSAGLGIAIRFSDAFSMGGDIYYTKWDEYTLTDSNGVKFSPIDAQFKEDADVSNTVQVRLGAEYLFINPAKSWIIALRGGLFYDPEPAHRKVKDFYGISLGSGISTENYSIDLAYQFRWGEDVETGNLIATTSADIQQHQLLFSMIYYF